MFDCSIGAGSVLMPYGGKYQLTETQAMVAKLPVLKGKTDTVTMMSYGFDPYLSSWSPYHGAVYAVMESMARIVAAGGDFIGDPFHLPGVFPQNDGGSANAGASPLRRCWARMTRSWASDFLPSAARIPCPEPSTISTYRPHWYPLQWMWQKNKNVITPELKNPGNKLVRFCLERDDYDLPVL